jgi:hypothetical protein
MRCDISLCLVVALNRQHKHSNSASIRLDDGFHHSWSGLRRPCHGLPTEEETAIVYLHDTRVGVFAGRDLVPQLLLASYRIF